MDSLPEAQVADFMQVRLPKSLRVWLWYRLRKARRIFKNTDLGRVERCLRSLTEDKGDARTGQYPVFCYFPGLRAKPFWDASDSPLTRSATTLLTRHAAEISREYLDVSSDAAVDRYPASDRYSSLHDNDWGGIMVWSRKGGFSECASKMPCTKAVITQLEEDLIDEVMFSVLKPGVTLPLHTDATNAQLTCHLGIDIPSQCGISVYGEKRSWETGGVLFFDHSYPHSAWNESKRARTVLLLNLRHPDVTKDEMTAIQYILAPSWFTRVLFTIRGLAKRGAHYLGSAKT